MEVSLITTASEVELGTLTDGQVFFYENNYYMKVAKTAIIGTAYINAIKVYQAEEDTSEVNDNVVFAPIYIAESTLVIPHDASLNIQI